MSTATAEPAAVRPEAHPLIPVGQVIAGIVDPVCAAALDAFEEIRSDYFDGAVAVAKRAESAKEALDALERLICDEVASIGRDMSQLADARVAVVTIGALAGLLTVPDHAPRFELEAIRPDDVANAAVAAAYSARRFCRREQGAEAAR